MGGTAAAAILSVFMTVTPAQTLECGQVITDDVTLTEDIWFDGFCDERFTIAADGVTLDLGGRTLEGGVLVEGRRGVTIRNGTLQAEQFNPGVILSDAPRTTIEDLTVNTPDGGWVEAYDSDRLRVTGGNTGVYLFGTDRASITDLRSGSFQRAVILLVDSDYNRIVDNRLNTNTDEPLRLDADSNRNKVLRNIAAGGDANYGIRVDGKKNVIIGNAARGFIADYRIAAGNVFRNNTTLD